MFVLHAGFLTALLSDPAQLTQLSSSYNSALELVQKSGLNLQAVGRALEDAQLSELDDQLKAQAELTQKVLKLPAGSSAVVTNGRVVVVESAELGVSEEFATEDFGLLVSVRVFHLVITCNFAYREGLVTPVYAPAYEPEMIKR